MQQLGRHARQCRVAGEFSVEPVLAHLGEPGGRQRGQRVGWDALSASRIVATQTGKASPPPVSRSPSDFGVG